jgi:hypothetical protein
MTHLLWWLGLHWHQWPGSSGCAPL